MSAPRREPRDPHISPGEPLKNKTAARTPEQNQLLRNVRQRIDAHFGGRAYLRRRRENIP